MAYRLIRRSEWGARHDDGTGNRRLPATQAWLHHSVTVAPDLVPPIDDDYAAIRTLEQIGESRFGAGISYTRLITPAGLVFEGHSIGRVGTHTGGRNSAAVGYCLVGNYDLAQPTYPQVLALAWCLQEDHRQGWLDAPRLDGGHRDLKSTACPGRYAYALIPEVCRLAGGPPVAATTAADRPPPLKEGTEDVIITCPTSDPNDTNYAGILSGGMLFDITGDAMARDFAQAAINKSIVAEIRVTEATWHRLAAASRIEPAG